MLGEMAKLSGRSLIGFREGAGSGDPLYAWDPTTGQPLQPGFIPATPEEVDRAAQLAADAFHEYSRTSGRERGAFLRKIADTRLASLLDSFSALKLSNSAANSWMWRGRKSVP